MKTHSVVLLALLVAGSALVAGCATTSSLVVPGADLSSIRKIHVVKLGPDARGINVQFANQLAVLGYQVTTGEATAVPADADAVLTYQDKWMWDLTMYMVELNAQLRNPRNDMILANARSFRPSLQRKSPPEMVKEVLGILLPKKP